MNRLLPSFRTATAYVVLGLLAACSKDSDTIPVGMSYTIDGSSVTAASSSARAASSEINVAGYPTSGSAYDRSVLLTVPKSTGTYDLSTSTSANAAYFTGSSSSSVYIATSGTISVTKYSSSNITGTFSFKGVNSSGSSTRNITNGKFNVNY